MLTLSSSAIKSALLYLWTMSWTRQKTSWHWAWGLACCIPQLGLALVLIAGKAVSPGLCFSNQEGQFSTWERLVSWATLLSPPGRNNIGRNSGSFCEWFFRQPQLTEALSSPGPQGCSLWFTNTFPYPGSDGRDRIPLPTGFSHHLYQGQREAKKQFLIPQTGRLGFFMYFI